jgi:hypothetical protein
VDAAIDFALEEAGGFEDAQMLGDGGERKGERLGELGDGGFTLREAGENGAAGGVGEGGEGGVERGSGIVNHTVYYCRGGFACQENCFGTFGSRTVIERVPICAKGASQGSGWDALKRTPTTAGCGSNWWRSWRKLRPLAICRDERGYAAAAC